MVIIRWSFENIVASLRSRDGDVKIDILLRPIADSHYRYNPNMLTSTP